MCIRDRATTETWGEYEKEDMSDLKVVEKDIVKVPYVIDGTGFDGTVVIENYNPDTWEEELERIHQRQEQLRSRGGAVTPEMTEGESGEGGKNEDKKPDDAESEEDVYKRQEKTCVGGHRMRTCGGMPCHLWKSGEYGILYRVLHP